MCVPYGVKANSDTDDDEWVSIFVLCMSVCVCVASKPFEFRIQCGVQQIFFDVFRLSFTFWTCYYCLLVPFLYFYAMVHLFYSIRFFIYYFFFSFLFFFLSETRSFPSGIRFGRQRDDDDTHSRKSQTQTHIYIYIHKQLVALWRIFYYWLFLLR